MKKLLLAGTAIAGIALMSAPAMADGLSVDVGGVYRGYAVWTDSDEDTGAASSLREFDFRRDSEIYVSGETTLDNGLTVGVHAELDLGEEPSGSDTTDEIYAYFSGGWGRVNFGQEDGVAYLLQVAAPSADSNVDGLRTYIQGINTGIFDGSAAGGSDFITLDYDNAEFKTTERFSYLTPKFNGFQAGFSYAPESGENAIGNNVAGMATDEDAGDFEDLWEVAARWDGEFEGVTVAAGVGYSRADTEADGAAGTVGSDELKAWDAGLTFGWDAFTVGGAYFTSDNGIDSDGDTTTWALGAGWENGPYTVGVSWYEREDEGNLNALASTDELDVDRLTVGGTYTFGPGMTFRGAVAFGEAESTGAADRDFTQVTVGTQINF